MAFSEEQAIAWATLHALRVPGEAMPRVLEAGGPEALLASPPSRLLDWLAAWSPRRKTTDEAALLDEVCRVASETRRGVQRMRAAGGVVLGGDRRELLTRVDRTSSPLCFYAWGETILLRRRPAVAIVGTRKASEHHLRRTERLARDLAEGGVVIVSGGARGIDLAAHRGALDAGGSTICITGQTLPPSSGRVRLRVSERGGVRLVMTPNAVNAGYRASMFASRNRFIAAQADVVIVVAGDVDSGTRYTSEAAQTLGVPVLAYPGDVDDPAAGLATQLLVTGQARPFRDAGDVLAVLAGASPPTQPRAPAAFTLPGPEPVAVCRASPLLDALDEPRTIDELAMALGCPAARILVEATELELEGAVRWSGPRLVRRG